MAADLERLAKEFRNVGRSEIADGANALARIARILHAPESFPSATSVEKPVVKTSGIPVEIPTVSEELYAKTREALAKEGYTFVVAIKSLSIDQLVLDPATSKRFSHVDPSKGMRDIVPQQMEVAINPKSLRIEGSNFKPIDIQKKMIKGRDGEKGLKDKLPPEVRDVISMGMQKASVLVQLDDQYQKATGEVLFTDWFSRTDHETASGGVTAVGRGRLSKGLVVSIWPRGGGSEVVFAILVVVLPRKLVV